MLYLNNRRCQVSKVVSVDLPESCSLSSFEALRLLEGEYSLQSLPEIRGKIVQGAVELLFGHLVDQRVDGCGVVLLD